PAETERLPNPHIDLVERTAACRVDVSHARREIDPVAVAVQIEGARIDHRVWRPGVIAAYTRDVDVERRLVDGGHRARMLGGGQQWSPTGGAPRIQRID